jgi:hypothetical protein
MVIMMMMMMMMTDDFVFFIFDRDSREYIRSLSHTHIHCSVIPVILYIIVMSNTSMCVCVCVCVCACARTRPCMRRCTRIDLTTIGTKQHPSPDGMKWRNIISTWVYYCSVDGWDDMLQARRSQFWVSVRSIILFSIYGILPAAPWPWGLLSL